MALRDIIVVGASAGGLPVLRRHLLPALPKNLNAAVFILVHRSTTGAIPRPQDYLLEVLARASQLVCTEPRDGAPLQRGCVYLAPRGRGLRLEKDTIRVDDDVAETVMRSGVDALFRSAAVAHGDRVAGVVLSGMLSDGSAGLWDVRRHGGVTIVQDPREAEHPSMPANAMSEVGVHYCLRGAEIGPKLVELATNEGAVTPTMRPARVLLVEDERIVAESLAKRLTGLGYEVAGSVATGEAALDLVARVAPDIVLMDVQLAGADEGHGGRAAHLGGERRAQRLSHRLFGRGDAQPSEAFDALRLHREAVSSERDPRGDPSRARTSGAGPSARRRQLRRLKRKSHAHRRP